LEQSLLNEFKRVATEYLRLQAAILAATTKGDGLRLQDELEEVRTRSGMKAEWEITAQSSLVGDDPLDILYISEFQRSQSRSTSILNNGIRPLDEFVTAKLARRMPTVEWPRFR
jgi:hypothetical protein